MLLIVFLVLVSPFSLSFSLYPSLRSLPTIHRCMVECVVTRLGTPITELPLRSVYCSVKDERGSSAPRCRPGMGGSVSKEFTYGVVARVGTPCVVLTLEFC